MPNPSGSTRSPFAPLWGVLALVYFVGAGISFLYFNWSYAQRNGFTEWLLFGEIVPTAQAAVWPYYVIRAANPATDWSRSQKATYMIQCTSAYSTTFPNPDQICTCLVTQFSKAVSFDEYDRIMRQAAATNASVTDTRMTSAVKACIRRP
jgi:hypothetical protein